jgi:AcrR family transcriptional regulator
MSPISPKPRKRRTDAARNIEGILDAASTLLSEQPDASMAEIAAAAGVARQTVYTHYRSRQELIAAAIDRAIDETARALDDARIDHGEPREALLALIETGWQQLERHHRLRALPDAPTAEQLFRQHAPILERLARLVRRGQRSGVFGRSLPVDWLLAATLGLFHAAADEVAAGRMTRTQAAWSLRETIPRLFFPGDDEKRPARTRRKLTRGEPMEAITLLPDEGEHFIRVGPAGGS